MLSGNDPTVVNLADPFRLWIIQVGQSRVSIRTFALLISSSLRLEGIIVATASLLSLVLQKIHQPKVIAEVLGGILLGMFFFKRQCDMNSRTDYNCSCK